MPRKRCVVGGVLVTALSFLMAASPVRAVTGEGDPNDARAVFGERWSFTGEPIEPFTLMPHRATYVLPFSYNDRPNEEAFSQAGFEGEEIQKHEFVYQISLKLLIARGLLGERNDLWFGYTQKAWWQAYNRAESQPFRETNYEPELIYTHRTSFTLGGLRARLLSLRVNHLSNGRGEEVSRNLNRLGVGVLFDDGEQALEVTDWIALPDESDVDGDDILDYTGRLQLAWYRPYGESTLRLVLRNNLSLDDNRTAFAVGYRFPFVGQLDGYAEYRYGYGDGLIDYDSISSRASIGVMLRGWH